MTDRNLGISITANVLDLQAKMAVAKAEMTAMTAKVRTAAQAYVSASEDMKTAAYAQLASVVAAAQGERAAIADLQAQIVAASTVNEQSRGVFANLAESVSGVTEKVEGLTAKFTVFSELASSVGEFVVAGLALEQVGDQVEKVVDVGVELLQMSEKTGIAVETLSALRLVAAQTDTEFSTLGNGLRELGLKMQEAIKTPTSDAAETFKALSISVADANGNLRPAQDVLAEVAEKLSGFADGTAKADDASNIFGAKIGASLIPFLDRLGTETLPGAQAAADNYGVSISQAAAESDEGFKVATTNVGASLEGLRDILVQGMIPGLTLLADDFVLLTGKGELLNDAAIVLGAAFDTVVIAADTLGTAIVDVAAPAAALITTFDSLTYAADAAGEAMKGNFSGAKQDLVAGAGNVSGAWKKAWSDITQASQDYEKTVKAMVAGPTANPAEAPKPQAPTISAGAGGNTADWTKQQDAALAQQNEQIEQTATTTKQANAEKLANTVQFWQGVLQAGNLTSAEELSAQNALTKAETAQRAGQLSASTAASNSAAQQQTQIAADAAQARKEIAASEYQARQSVWDAEVATGKISKDQEIQDEQAAENQMYQAALAEANQEAALATAGTVAKAKAFDDIEVLTAAHNATMAKLNDDLVTQQMADTEKLQDQQTQAAAATAQAWQRAFQPITQAFDTSINGVIQGTETLKQAETKAAASIALAFIDAEAKKVVAFGAGEAMILARGVASQLGLVAATEAGTTAKLAIQATGNAAGRAMDAATNSVTINNAAYTAAGEAYKAVVGVPYIGPVLAPAAAATAYVGVMAFDVLSAAGGMSIPAGVNPLTQLHEREMVLPAHIAQPLVQMLQGAGAGSGGDTNVTNHFNISANGPSGSVTAEDVLSALNGGLRSGSLQKYPAIARMMRR